MNRFHSSNHNPAVSLLSTWSDEIGDAVAESPEHRKCSRDLYLALLELNVSRGGLVALVTRHDEPTCVIGLRRDGHHRLKNFTNWLIPGFISPSDDDHVLSAFAEIRREVLLAWWRMPSPPSHPNIRQFNETPVHRLRVADREAYWRAGSMYRTIRRARSRCSHLTVTFNELGGAEWTIRSAARKWEGQAADHDGSVDLKVETANALERSKRHVTIVLRDGSRRLAGQTCVVDDETIVMTGIFRDASIGSLPTGVRVMDEVFEYAAREGIPEVDLGGGYAYKAQWAPVNDARYELDIAPALQYRVRTLATAALHRH